MSERIAFTGELDLNFCAQQEFESLDGVETSKQSSILIRNFLRVLMMGWTPSWKQLITPAIAHAVFVQRNPELLRELRFEFQQGFLHLFQQLEGQTYHEQAQLYLSNCLSLLPYSDLTAYESIKVPQYVDEQWELVEYQVRPIELTKGTEQDADRVFAYGLEPLFQTRAESHLIYMGTTYPAGQGFLSQISTDSKGFESVGKSLYRTGRARVQAWLEQQNGKIHVCGTSLGGSLSLLLAIDQGNYQLSRVDALNPAGLHNARNKSQFDHWNELSDKPRVVIQKQGDDPVSHFGVWKEDWEILHIAPPADKKGPNGFWDHAINYAGLKETQFTYIDAKEDNAQRNRRNLLLFSLGRGFIYYAFLVPYTYVIRPAAHFFAKHWPLLIILPCLALIASLAALGILGSVPFAAIASVLVVGAISVVLVPIIREALTPKILTRNVAKMHDPLLPRNISMDIYDLDNAVDMDLTYEKVNTYYKLIRSINDKEFMPKDDRASKHVKGISKKALLEASEHSENAKIVVPFHVTKAKASHIRHTLTLIDKLGAENQEKLRQSIDEQHQEYCLGKHQNL